jgi:glycosyltransferase involved in cell wall biosynthesis
MSTHYETERLKRLPSWFRRFRKLEANIYNRADHIVLNTPWNQEEIIRLFSVPREKTSSLPNGYDPELLPDPHSEPSSSQKKLHLLYVSGLRGRFFEGPFYESLAIIKKQSPELYSMLDVHFVGADNFPDRVPQSLGIDKDIHLHGFVEQRALEAFYSKADAFLLILPASTVEKGSGCVPQKLYNYLYLEKPILALVPTGQTMDYLSEYGSGNTKIVPPDNPSDIAKGLSEWLTAFRDNRFHEAETISPGRDIQSLGKPYLAAEMIKLFQTRSVTE